MKTLRHEITLTNLSPKYIEPLLLTTTNSPRKRLSSNFVAETTSDTKCVHWTGLFEKLSADADGLISALRLTEIDK